MTSFRDRTNNAPGRRDATIKTKEKNGRFLSDFSFGEEEELEEEEEECFSDSDWSQEDPLEASNSFLTKVVKAHKKAMETSEEERKRVRDLLYKAEDRCEELLEMNDALEKRLEKNELRFKRELEEMQLKAESFPERRESERNAQKLKSDVAAMKTMNASLERQVESLRIREREREEVVNALRDELAKMKSSSSSSSAETTERLRDARKMEEQKEKQTLAVIAETYAIEIRKLKEKVEMYEKARLREKTFSGSRVEKKEQQQRQHYFSNEESEDVEDDDEEEPRPPPTAAKRLPSDSESPFGTLNSEGRVRAAISRLGILDDNGDVPKMRNF